MEDLVSTNIRLPERLHERLRAYATRHGKSLAQVVREAVEAHISEPELDVRQLTNDPFFRVIGIGEGKAKKHAADHDEELYGDHA